MQHPPKNEPKPRKHRKKLLLILTAVFVLLAAAFVLLLPTIKTLIPAPAPITAEQVQTQQTIVSHDPATIQSIHISHIAGDEYTLYLVDGNLCLQQGDLMTPIEQSAQESMLNVTAHVVVQDVVTEDASEVADHLADMGLSPVQSTAVIRYDDEQEVTLEIGIQVPGTNYYYYQWSGDNGIYMCDLGTAETLGITEKRLIPVTQPILEKTLMDNLTLEIKGKEPINITFSTDSAGYVAGLQNKPFIYPLNAAASYNLLTSLHNFRLGTAEGVVTDDNRSEYGFDDPLCVITLHQMTGPRAVINSEGQWVSEILQEQSFRFVIGREEGSYFYTCEYEGQGYMVSRFLIATRISADPASLITLTPANLGEDVALSAIALQTGAGATDIRITRTEQVLENNALATDDEGNIIYDTVVTVDGAQIDEEIFDAMLPQLQGFTISGDLPDGWTVGAASPRWKMTITTSGGTVRTILAYPLDAFSDALVVDGVAKHYAHIEALDIAMGTFMPKAVEDVEE